MAKKKSVYEIVTQQIIEDLEAGIKPWECEWNSSDPFPVNLDSGKHYQGINVLLLWMSQVKRGFNSSHWVTYKQAEKLGGGVKKGEKSSMVTYFQPLEKEKPNGDKESFCVFKYYRVFNVDQCEGLELPKKDWNELEFKPIKKAQEIIDLSGAEIRHGGSGAFYRPDEDYIQLPNKEDFKTVEGYYRTAMHELTHWTGEEHRLKRDKDRTCKKKYAFEELVAEIGASFLCATSGIKYETTHADYIGNWLQLLKNDSKAVIRAASQAKKAHEYLIKGVKK